MKNEERIIELLAEYLKKSDQREEQFGKMEQLVAEMAGRNGNMENAVAAQTQILEKLTDKTVGLERAVERLASSINSFVDVVKMQHASHEQRIFELERRMK